MKVNWELSSEYWEVERENERLRDGCVKWVKVEGGIYREREVCWNKKFENLKFWKFKIWIFCKIFEFFFNMKWHKSIWCQILSKL